MAKTIQRKATDYLNIGDKVRIPEKLAAPVVYDVPNGRTVREGVIVEKLLGGGVCVNLGGKCWDYSNKEALTFSRYY